MRGRGPSGSSRVGTGGGHADRGAGPGAVETSNAANEVGVTAKTINVAVVADVDNPIAPGVLQGIVDGVQGWGKYVNANGGIGGRKVQVDFIDSKLNPNDDPQRHHQGVLGGLRAGRHRHAAPARRVDDITSCADSAGQGDRASPTSPRSSRTHAEACAPTAYPITPPSVECDTRDQHPQTYRANNGDSKYLLKKQQGSARRRSCSPATRHRWRARRRCSTRRRRRRASRPTSSWNVTANSPQSAVHADHPGDEERQLELRPEPPGRDRRRRRAAGSAAPGPHRPEDRLGVHARLLPRRSVIRRPATSWTASTWRWRSCPSTRGSANPMTEELRQVRGQGQAQRLRQLGLHVRAAVRAGGEGRGRRRTARTASPAPTCWPSWRTSTTSTPGAWSARPTSATRCGTSCFMLDQFKSGKFVRIYPTKKGTFDCNKSNVVHVPGQT